MASVKIEKLAAQILEICAQATTARIDPNILVTVVDTQLSPDAKYAKVLVSIKSESSFDEAAILNDLRKMFAKALSTKLVSKFTPQIIVIRDYRIEDAAKVSRLAKN